MSILVLDTYHAEVKVNKFKYDLEIFDTAFGEDLDFLLPLILPCTNCVIMCYSSVHEDSLKNIVEFLHPKLIENNFDIPYILCGNKLDLKDEYPNLYVSNETAEELTDEIKNIKVCVQCSAKEDIRKNKEYAGSTNRVFQYAIKEAIIFQAGIRQRSELVCFNCTIL